MRKATTLVSMLVSLSCSAAMPDTVRDEARKLLPSDVKNNEYVVIVNKNDSAQSIYVARKGNTEDTPFIVEKESLVSTGNEKRKGYFETPVGAFAAMSGKSYRAEGTKNSQGVRGLGIKGSRIWDFGWQATVKGGYPQKIRLQMHGTDPDMLEQRLGSKASKGCVRVSTDMNRYIDENGVLDKAWRENDSPSTYQLHEKQRKTPSENIGKYMIVVDVPIPKEATNKKTS